ncbi:ORF6N domain-containing protein [Limnobaculum xujianqingii]|uniref:ORF6N domain-containing protein n=1 Tax=Limnobaculum xujianqingii TaxID=2738837 RepID=UPI001E356DE1|nr:ORF6N domain-containing protein [Limnobaculum xujianqingii]
MNQLNATGVVSTIAVENLPVIEWQGARVVTTETLAAGYGTTASNLRANLSNHRSRFIEGVHVITLTGDEVQILCANNIDAQISNKARSLTLYTEKGAARMSKIVDTDEAWSFFEKMESAYFRDEPESELEMIARIASEAVANQRRMKQFECRVNGVERQIEQISSGAIPPGWQTIKNLSSEGGLSVQKTRDLIKAFSLESKKVPFMTPVGILSNVTVVREDDFLGAIKTVLNESTRPVRSKYWYHPKIGRFEMKGTLGLAQVV